MSFINVSRAPCWGEGGRALSLLLLISEDETAPVWVGDIIQKGSQKEEKTQGRQGRNGDCNMRQARGRPQCGDAGGVRALRLAWWPAGLCQQEVKLSLEELLQLMFG